MRVICEFGVLVAGKIPWMKASKTCGNNTWTEKSKWWPLRAWLCKRQSLQWVFMFWICLSHANRHGQSRCQRHGRYKCGVHPCSFIPMQAMPELVTRHLLSRDTRCLPQNDMKNVLECLSGPIEPQQIITCHARRASVLTFFGVDWWDECLGLFAMQQITCKPPTWDTPINVLIWAWERIQTSGLRKNKHALSQFAFLRVSSMQHKQNTCTAATNARMRILGPIWESTIRFASSWYFRQNTPQKQAKWHNQVENSLGTKSTFLRAKNPNRRKPPPNGPKTGALTQNQNKLRKTKTKRHKIAFRREICAMHLHSVFPVYPLFPRFPPHFSRFPPRFLFSVKFPDPSFSLRIAPRICKNCPILATSAVVQQFCSSGSVWPKILHQRPNKPDMALTLRWLHNKICLVFHIENHCQCFPPSSPPPHVLHKTNPTMQHQLTVISKNITRTKKYSGINSLGCVMSSA